MRILTFPLEGEGVIALSPEREGIIAPPPKREGMIAPPPSRGRLGGGWVNSHFPLKGKVRHVTFLP
jgi:hypothetical protein